MVLAKQQAKNMPINCWKKKNKQFNEIPDNRIKIFELLKLNEAILMGKNKINIKWN